MRNIVEVFAVVLLIQQCISQPLEETVVSVYTTHPTTMGTNPPVNVYHQIANNIAERITSPIYRFLGLNSTNSETTTKLWDSIELQDDHDLTNKQDVKPIDNDISKDRDVEELSVEGIKAKTDKKPEKITLYSSYLPVLAKASQAATVDIERIEADDPFSWDSDKEVTPKPREGPFVYILEFFGNIFQLVWGGLMTLFRPSAGSGKSSGDI